MDFLPFPEWDINDKINEYLYNYKAPIVLKIIKLPIPFGQVKTGNFGT